MSQCELARATTLSVREAAAYAGVTVRQMEESIKWSVTDWPWSQSDLDRYRDERRARRLAKGLIYFALCGDAVKIGYTTNLVARMGSLQTGASEKLKVIFKRQGQPADEKALHKRFARDRLAGEWFRHSEAIKAFIADAQRYTDVA